MSGWNIRLQMTVVQQAGTNDDQILTYSLALSKTPTRPATECRPLSASGLAAAVTAAEAPRLADSSVVAATLLAIGRCELAAAAGLLFQSMPSDSSCMRSLLRPMLTLSTQPVWTPKPSGNSNGMVLPQ